jgi:integration host factor subunit beta
VPSVSPDVSEDAAGGLMPPASASGDGAEPMTRSELIERLAEQFPQLVAKDAEFAVRAILEAMARTLANGQRIEIRGFGSFAVSYRPPRVGRNPKSGEKVLVPGKRVPHFKPGKDLREQVDLGPMKP